MVRAKAAVAERPHARRGPILLGALLLILLLPSIGGEPLTKEIPEAAGTSWFMPESHHLFLNSDHGLNRTYPLMTGEPYGVRFDRIDTSLNPRIVTASSDPVVDGVQFTGNVTIRLFAGLESANIGCRFTNPIPDTPADAMTSFGVRLIAGGVEVGAGETNREVMEYDWESPVEFTYRIEQAEFNLGVGDTMDLEVDVHHNCLQAGVLYWNAYETTSGIVMEGDLFEPELSASVDLNRVARVELTPISPWGTDDYLLTRMELVGPMQDWQEAVHGNYREETHLDHFERPDGSRLGEGNRTVWTWTANGTLQEGIHMVDACIVLRDQDPNDDCHIVGVDRFMAPEIPDPLLSGLYLILLIPLALLAWLGSSLRIGLLPWPGYLVLALMAIALIGPAMQLPDIEAGGVRDETAAPPFSLLTHGGGEGNLGALLAGNDVLVLGVFEVDSPAAEIQRRDFLNASAVVGDEVAFAQLATGEMVDSVDLNRYADLLNGSWPLLIDESASGVASQLPSGPADAVVVIDKGGFVSSWSPGSMDHYRIANEVTAAAAGSRRTPMDLFSNILLGGLALIPLALLALPREKSEAPEDALVPAAGLLGTAGAGALGFAMVALPTVLLALLLRGGFWVFVETALAGWMIWHAFAMLTRGHIPELRMLVERCHGRLPAGFRKWRGEDVFDEDAHLGLWLVWIAFLIDPLMLAQGVASRALTGITGIASSVGMFLGFLLMAGICVIIIRSVAAIAGPFSRIGGMFSQGARPRLWGAVILVLAIWNIAVITAGPLLGRLL